MLRGASSVGNLRKAIGAFLAEHGEDRQFSDLAAKARALDTGLRTAGGGGKEDKPSPGQKAAGLKEARRDGEDAAASTTSRAREQMGGPATSAKGDDSNLPPFMRRQKAKRSATARGGS